MIDSTPWQLIGHVFVLGAALGMLEHTMRSIFSVFSRRIRSVGDVLFWIIAVGVTFLCVYEWNGGDVQGYMYGILVAGAMVYYWSCGTIVEIVFLRPLLWGVDALRTVCRWIGGICRRGTTQMLSFVVQWSRGFIGRNVCRDRAPPTIPKE